MNINEAKKHKITRKRIVRHYDLKMLKDEKKGDKLDEKTEYSDYELYQLLDESGYKPNERNLLILKEGLETGKYYILNK